MVVVETVVVRVTVDVVRVIVLVFVVEVFVVEVLVVVDVEDVVVVVEGHPTPSRMQHQSCCARDHARLQCFLNVLQSKVTSSACTDISPPSVLAAPTAAASGNLRSGAGEKGDHGTLNSSA